MPSFANQVPHFYTGVLSKFPTAIPSAAQWVVEFDNLTEIGDTIKTVITNFEPTGWSIDASIDKILENTDAISTKGFVLAQGVEVPPESYTAVPFGIQQGGYLRTIGGQGRDPYQGIRIAFLDTNISFTELFVRPWVIATSHIGLIDKPKSLGSGTVSTEYKYRTDMVLYKLGRKSIDDTEPTVLRTYRFKDVCPVSIAGEEYNYSPQTGPTIQETVFLFKWYTIEGPASPVLTFVPSDSAPLATSTFGVNTTATAS
jgi:hypothetical protein